MSARRQRTRAQNQINNQLLSTEETSDDKVKEDSVWKEKLGDYLIDISKYIMTGVVIASLFKDVGESGSMIYILGLFIAFITLGVGLVLTNKKNRKKGDK